MNLAGGTEEDIILAERAALDMFSQEYALVVQSINKDGSVSPLIESQSD